MEKREVRTRFLPAVIAALGPVFGKRCPASTLTELLSRREGVDSYSTHIALFDPIIGDSCVDIKEHDNMHVATTTLLPLSAHCRLRKPT